MINSKRNVWLGAAAVAFVMLAACANQKEPAERAVANIDKQLGEFRADAEKYAADELQSVDTSIKRLKDNLAKQDYGNVVRGAPSVAGAVNSLKSAVAEKKADAEQMLAAAQGEWTELTTSVPPMVEKLQAKVDSLAKSRRMPKGMDKAAWENAKGSFEALKTEWTEAGTEFASGQAASAVRKARNAKARAQDLISKLEA